MFDFGGEVNIVDEKYEFTCTLNRLSALQESARRSK